ncbi:PAS domain S-box-containing protein [Actinocorallia herbida]|uniref:PAS domain S-box-containing protein n=1 Tax=Actinocorallia herbida TaxID=58109 RepID=A0A3N1DDN1_9ACTN|nr:SpoIIE family protein phosphatase [Actinocorallia herbida]ROO91288.1 PAS domain S-box-containing protein [Actinocorallia herbida]
MSQWSAAEDGARAMAGAPGFDAELPPETVFSQMEMAVIVTDRFSNIISINAFAKKLFGFGGDEFIGQSVLSLGIAEEDHDQAMDLARHVLKGGVWEGTFCNLRDDGTPVYTRAQAVPLRHPSGSIDGVAIFAREALRSNQREQDRYGLLDRIGTRLAASLELDVTLRAVAGTLVPQFADHLFIDLVTGDKLVRRVAAHARDWTPPPGTWAEPGEQVDYPYDDHAAKAIRRRDAVLAESTGPDSAFGVTSMIAAPLVARGEVLGVMSLALSNLGRRPDPHYDEFDRTLVGAIASRVALSIDNALLFEEERQTALAFQRQLLPGERPPDLDGLKIAWRYEPAPPLESHGQGVQTQVGGDWYDVIPLSAGRVGIVIGDVEGRGARAAAVMGQLRAALRAFAQDDKSPADIMRKLDEWTRGMARPDTPRPPVVSCSYFVYDAWSRELTWANAGHHPPLLAVGDIVGDLDFSRSTGAMLGMRHAGLGGDAAFEEETVVLAPGSMLVLYTDGLTEGRPKADGSFFTGEESRGLVRAAVSRASRGDVEGVAHAVFSAVPGEIDDDVALVVIRTAPEELAVRERTFPAEPIMVSEARRLASDTFTAWGLGDDAAETACLLVSEIVTNVVLHATNVPAQKRALVGAPELSFDEDDWDLSGGLGRPEPVKPEFRLRLRRGARALWVEVFDPDLRLPRIRNAGETDEGGRGLYLVDQIAARWGSRPTPNGKAVWFELPLD